MPLRRQLTLLALWAAVLALAVLIVVYIRDQPPAPPQAGLGVLTQAVLNATTGSGTPQQQISLSTAHPAQVGTDQVT